jgi:phosphohistidine phosphatase
MIVIFLRHGDAEASGRGTPGGDAGRELTDRGRKETEAVAAALDRLHLRPAIILTSPLVRAVQTAELAARELKKAPVPAAVESLAPGNRWEDVRADILELVKPEDDPDTVVLLCGHQPDMGQYLAQALARQPGSGLDIRKSAAICVEWENADLSAVGRICLALDPQSADRILRLEK